MVLSHEQLVTTVEVLTILGTVGPYTAARLLESPSEVEWLAAQLGLKPTKKLWTLTRRYRERYPVGKPHPELYARLGFTEQLVSILDAMLPIQRSARLMPCLLAAAQNGHLLLCWHLIAKYEISGARILKAAAVSGQVELMVHFLDSVSYLPPTALNDALAEAVENGQVEAAQILLNYGAIVTSEVLERAIGPNCEAVLKLLLSHGPLQPADFGEALSYAVDDGSLEVVRLLVEAGATKLEAALEMAQKSNQKSEAMISYLTGVILGGEDKVEV